MSNGEDSAEEMEAWIMPETGDGDITVDDIFKDFKKYLDNSTTAISKQLVDTESAFRVLYNQARELDS
jgi:hypothetical protein